MEEMRRVVDILPKRALYRVNLALYAAYGSDFQTAEQEARAAEEGAGAVGVEDGGELAAGLVALDGDAGVLRGDGVANLVEGLFGEEVGGAADEHHAGHGALRDAREYVFERLGHQPAITGASPFPAAPRSRCRTESRERR